MFHRQSIWPAVEHPIEYVIIKFGGAIFFTNFFEFFCIIYCLITRAYGCAKSCYLCLGGEIRLRVTTRLCCIQAGFGFVWRRLLLRWARAIMSFVVIILSYNSFRTESVTREWFSEILLLVKCDAEVPWISVWTLACSTFFLCNPRTRVCVCLVQLRPWGHEVHLSALVSGGSSRGSSKLHVGGSHSEPQTAEIDLALRGVGAQILLQPRRQPEPGKNMQR